MPKREYSRHVFRRSLHRDQTGDVVCRRISDKRVHGCEGLHCDVVAKNFDAPYRSGRRKTGPKSKNRKAPAATRPGTKLLKESRAMWLARLSVCLTSRKTLAPGHRSLYINAGAFAGLRPDVVTRLFFIEPRSGRLKSGTQTVQLLKPSRQTHPCDRSSV